VAVGTLDLNQGVNLPAEDLVGALPAADDPVPSHIDCSHDGNRQGLTLVYFSAQRKHCLWDTLGTFSRFMGHYSSQTGHTTGSLTRIAQVELNSGRV